MLKMAVSDKSTQQLVNSAVSEWEKEFSEQHHSDGYTQINDLTFWNRFHPYLGGKEVLNHYLFRFSIYKTLRNDPRSVLHRLPSSHPYIDTDVYLNIGSSYSMADDCHGLMMFGKSKTLESVITVNATYCDIVVSIQTERNTLTFVGYDETRLFTDHVIASYKTCF